MQKHFLIITLLLLSSNLFSQQEFGTHFMNGTWQANMTNIAQLPSNKVIVSLPGFYGNLGISNITYNDIFDDNGQTDFDHIISQLEADNYFRTNIAFQTFGVGIRTKRLFISLNHEIRSNTTFGYPKALAQLIWQGNAQFIGETVSFAPDIQITNWHQIGLGIGYEINDMITVGARFKKLSGIADLSSRDDSYLKLTTSDDVYQLSLDADYSIRTSGILDFTDFTDYNVNLSGVDLESFNKLFSKNGGFSLDLGATVTFDKLTVGASVLDIGGINWEENATQYSVKGDYEFAGITFAENIFEDSLELVSVIDTIKQIYQPTESQESYRSTLPRQFYLSGNYSLNEDLKVGALFYLERYRGQSYPAFSLAANYSLLNLLKIGAAYTIRKGSADNLGLNAALKLGPIQLILATDNVFTVINPKAHSRANGRIGLNLVFGKIEDNIVGGNAVDFY